MSLVARSNRCWAATECLLTGLYRFSLIHSATSSAETADVEHRPNLALGASQSAGQIVPAIHFTEL